VGEAGGCGKGNVLMGVAGSRRGGGQEKSQGEEGERGHLRQRYAEQRNTVAVAVAVAVPVPQLCTARSPATAVLAALKVPSFILLLLPLRSRCPVFSNSQCFITTTASMLWPGRKLH
jgi:hypothetical protein